MALLEALRGATFIIRIGPYALPVVLATISGCIQVGDDDDTGSTADSASDSDETLVEGSCSIADATDAPDYLADVPCTADFLALSSEPLDATLPGARSVKVVLDLRDGEALYFQNSTRFEIHYDFVSTHLSGGDLPVVGSLSDFNATEYYSPDRSFVLGAVTRYEDAGVWTLELSPYDTASAAMITELYDAVREHAFFGPKLAFHPTSDNVAATAANLDGHVRVVTTDEIYAGIDYQPLSLGSAIGRVHFLKAADLANTYVSYQEILVLDEAPNDISVVQGLVTETFQTPLSHVNVLSQNRRTPNMGLRDAWTNWQLRAVEGELAYLEVRADGWSIRFATEEEATSWWAEHRPEQPVLPALDLEVTDVVDVQDVTPDADDEHTLRDNILKAVRAFGGKVAHYSVLARTPGVPIKPAFAIPVYHYDQFMRVNGFYDRIETLLQDESFTTDAAVRDTKLADLRADMMTADVSEELQDALRAKITESAYAGHKIRFRTSTNSEDLDGFPCAGCYESHTGDPADWQDVLDAIRETWASAWLFRTFEERTYYGVAHDSVGMALLVHANFPDEEANGVAVTANPFDPSGLDPAFYVNVQTGGDAEVVAPPPGVTSDQILYYFGQPNQPTTYLTHSNLVADGTTVLSARQLHDLGTALGAIHTRFSEAYGPAAGNQGWYAMDVEFKFDDDADPGQPATLYVKQARPYPGRGE